MWTVSVWTSVILCSACIWQRTEAGCIGQSTSCETDEDCDSTRACLMNPLLESVCRKCYCDERDQCETFSGKSVYCDCDGYSDIGRYCKCKKCPGQCLPGFKQCRRTCSCYFVSPPSDQNDFNGAMYACMEKKAFLVKITSRYENYCVHKFIQKEAGERFWIGASDSTSEGNWIWEDGTSINYDNWDKDEPSNSTDEDFAAMHKMNGKWSDNDDQETFRYVCEHYM